MKPFSIVVAFDSHYGIGKNGNLPWNLPSDLKHFKGITSTTANPNKKNAVVMGRKTWDSIPDKFKPLSGRVNVILSKQAKLDVPADVLVFDNLDEALKQLSVSDVENIFVIGGAQVYAQAMSHPLCQRLYVTHVQGSFNCDAFFPAISQQFFPIGSSEPFEENGMRFQFSEYLRS